MSNTVNASDILDKKSSELVSLCPTELQPRQYDYKHELVFHFYTAMLEAVVDSWEAYGNIECPESLSSVNKVPVEAADVASVELDEVVEGEGEEDEVCSFLKSAEQIEGHKKLTSATAIDMLRLSKKGSSGRKSKRSTRKSSASKRKHTAESFDDIMPRLDDWIIEPVYENVIITFKNGNIYEGPVFGKAMHGCGQFMWANGTTYTGTFSHGALTGTGSLTLPDGSRYSGSLVRGHRHGAGATHAGEGGALHRGSWRAGRKHGRGWQLFRHNDWFDGDWADDAMAGAGVRQYPSGARYHGEWRQGKRSGKGTAVLRNNDGTFSHGALTGTGSLALPDGSRYSGSLVRGHRHGAGATHAGGGGALHRGGWRAGRKHGRGWQLFRHNDWFDGDWADDAMAGAGVRQYPSGARYHGEWRQGKRSGKGTAVLRNNDFYNGDWCEGKRKGYGEYTWSGFYNKTFSVPVQSSYFGSWDKNQMHGIGVINFGMEGGARYAGCFENNEKHGAGVIICENGSTIESNPLFLHDKPVHLTNNGSFNISADGESVLCNTDTAAASTDTINDFVNSSFVSDLTGGRKPSSLKSITRQIYLPANSLDNSTIAKIELCKLAFPNVQKNYLSLCVPVNTPTEIIVLNYYLNQISDFASINTGIPPKDYLLHSDPKSKLTLHQCCPDTPTMHKQSLASSIKETAIRKYQLECEEKSLRKAITTHLPRLRAIYKQYAAVASLKELPFKALLIRMFLWQLYRDCRIPERGVALSRLDELLAQNPDTELETLHSPFEIIYFWQFLHSLIAVAVNLYAKECAEFVHEGILRTAFVRLLESDVYPNYGQHKGCVLFDYVDVLPIKAAYKWFQDYKEPFTVLKFLRNACTIKKCDPPLYYCKSVRTENVHVPMGVNACAIGHEIIYLKDELPNIQTETIEPETKVSDEEPYKKLFGLRSLGAKTVLSILAKVCPKVKEDNEIVNMEYEMTFYEFYEAVLLCTQEFVDRENKRKAREKRAEEEALLLVQKMSSIGKTRKFSARRRSIRKRIHISIS